MARTRMYLFERAYVDYAHYFRAIAKWFREQCKNIWLFFWEKRESLSFLIKFYFCVATLFYASLFIFVFRQNYPKDELIHKFILTYAIIVVSPLVWQPIHCVTLGLAAAVIIIAFFLLIFATIGSLFLCYLLVLFSLTISTLFIFVPIRLIQKSWLLYRHITYQCPYNDCSYTALPIHICQCGVQYPNLTPSFYGIFYHTCIHGEKNFWLPTTDLLGRKKYQRRCGGCKRSLIFSSLGELGVHSIAIVGGPSAGKSVFITQAVQQLQFFLQQQPQSQVYIDSQEQQQKMERFIHQLENGQVLDKTVGEIIKALAIAIKLKSPKQFRRLLYLYDEPGEDFTQIERFGKKQMIQNLAGLILLVDPFSIDILTSYGEKQKQRLKPSKASFYKIVIVMVNGVTQMRLARVNSKCHLPVAVIISKRDALPIVDYPYLEQLDDSESCRAALEKLGEGRSIRALEQKFSNIKYFSCSALGRLPDDSNKAFIAEGVLDPIQWLLNLSESTNVS